MNPPTPQELRWLFDSPAWKYIAKHRINEVKLMHGKLIGLETDDRTKTYLAGASKAHLETFDLNQLTASVANAHAAVLRETDKELDHERCVKQYLADFNALVPTDERDGS